MITARKKNRYTETEVLRRLQLDGTGLAFSKEGSDGKIRVAGKSKEFKLLGKKEKI